MKNRIAVFIDGGNFFFLQRDHLQWWVDPKRLLEWVDQQGEVTEAIYYAGYDPSDSKQMGYLKALTHMGYSLDTKEVKWFEKDNGERVKKANMDCDIVADMFLMHERYDTAYLVSGDTDFASSLTRLRTLGKGFKVLSSGNIISNEIREVSGRNLIDFEDIREHVEKQPKTEVAA